MPLLIPPAVNYPSPINPTPSFSQDQPKEGRRQVTCEILWGSMGGARKCVAMDMSGNRATQFSQVSTLKIDNSSCGSDVVFIFPDTLETIAVPAGTPLAVVPVYSNSTQFYVSCPTATPEDITRFVVLNYHTDPAGVSTSETGAYVASTSGIWKNPPNPPVQLIGATVNGTLEILQIGTSFRTSYTPPTAGEFDVVDGTGNKIIDAWKMGLSPAASSINWGSLVVNLENMNARFRQGIQIVHRPISGWNGESNVNMFATYRQP